MTNLIRQAAEDIAQRRDDVEWIERVIRDAIDREREACAKIADATRTSSVLGDFGAGQENAAEWIAQAIRARNVTKP